jgi:hypothetical protein
MSAIIVDFKPRPAPPPAATPRAVGVAGGVSADGRPLAPSKGRRGRPFYTDTPLGKLTSERGLKVVEVSTGAGINPRSLSDYMSARRKMPAPVIAKLAAFFGVPEQVFIDMNRSMGADRPDQ